MAFYLCESKFSHLDFVLVVTQAQLTIHMEENEFEP